MISERILFKVNDFELTGILEVPEPKVQSVIIVLHPHPLYGGDKYNPVVTTLVESFQEVGLATFRFDFRGVSNRSAYAGIPGAVDDASAASRMLVQKGFNVVGIAGYSFGGSTALRFSSANRLKFVVSVSSSLALIQEGNYEATQLSRIACSVLMVHGTADMTVPFENMTNISSHIDGNVKTISIDDEGHFYHRSLNKVQYEVNQFLRTIDFE
ncbi:MAG: dienelactone hydrolase family protein [Candidatus Thorarchaeota archaeon]